MHGVNDEKDEKEIASILDSEPLCAKIVGFLLEHEGAMDTVRGVARCWVNSDEIAVQGALDQLASVGIVASHALSSGTYYRLTARPSIREQLQACRLYGVRAKASVLGKSNGNES
jgi:hypothetical protein